MDKKYAKKDKVQKNQKNKDSHKHHHHKRKNSLDMINSRFINFMEKVSQKNDSQMSVLNSNSINILNKKNQNELKLDKTRINLKRNSSNISITRMENNYFKNKLESLLNPKKDVENNNHNIKYNIIINNNKTNYYYKGANLSQNDLTFESQIKNQKPSNLKKSSITNYIKDNSVVLQSKISKEKNNIKNESNINNYTNRAKNIRLNKKNLNKTEIIFNEYIEEKNMQNEEINKKKIKNKENENKLKEEKKPENRSNNTLIKSQIKEKKEKNNDKKISSKNLMKSIYNEDKKILIEKENEKTLIEQEITKKQKKSGTKENFRKKITSYLTNYIDLNTISETYPGGFNYLQNKFIYLDVSCTEEEFNFIYDQKDLYKSFNAKELCRKGIPIKYMKKFIKKLLKLENCKENYNFKYSMIINDLDTNYIGDYVPYYHGKSKKKLKEILHMHYLNDEGIKQLKVIMWLISDLVPKIEYSPFLVKICSILLIFFEKEEAFEAMRTLIGMNYDPTDIYKVRWHFRYSFVENKKLIESIKIFLENKSDNIKELFDILKKKGLEPITLINDFVESCFLDFLNFYGIIRFITIFLYEGVKSFYRISFGILNYIYEKNLEEIENCRKDLMAKLKKIIFNTFDYNKIFEDSFSIQLSRFNNGYIKNGYGEDIEELEIPYECASKYYNEDSDNDSFPENENYNENDEENIEENENEKEKEKQRKKSYISNFYLPSIDPKSNILTSKYIFRLWPNLPKKFKRNNLATIYSLSRKKVNMKTIIELSQKYPKNYNILILIETEQEELFGFILPQMLEDTGENKYIKLKKCYLINFLPKVNIYKDYNEIISENMLCCNKKGLWFCKMTVGDLIYINGTLTEGKTCKENTYFGKVCLTKKENFLIKDLEIIVFVSNEI